MKPCNRELHPFRPINRVLGVQVAAFQAHHVEWACLFIQRSLCLLPAAMAYHLLRSFWTAFVRIDSRAWTITAVGGYEDVPCWRVASQAFRHSFCDIQSRLLIAG